MIVLHVVEQIERKAYFTFPVISLIVSVVIIVIANFHPILFGFQEFSTRFLFLILVIVFSAFAIVGNIDTSLYGSKIGLVFAKFLHLIDRNNLSNGEYKQDVVGIIGKGAGTIEITLTVIWLIIFLLSG